MDQHQSKPQLNQWEEMTHFQYLEQCVYVMTTFSECSPACAAPWSAGQRGCHGEASTATVIASIFVPAYFVIQN